MRLDDSQKASQATALADLRGQALKSLLVAADTGALEEALAGTRAPASGTDNLRQKARAQLSTAAQTGDLDRLLTEVSDPPVRKEKAQKALLGALEDGSLEAMAADFEGKPGGAPLEDGSPDAPGFETSDGQPVVVEPPRESGSRSEVRSVCCEEVAMETVGQSICDATCDLKSVLAPNDSKAEEVRSVCCEEVAM